MPDSPPPSPPNGDEPSSPPASEPSVKRYYLIFFQTGLEHDGHGEMQYPVFQHIQNLLDENIDSLPEATEIDVWIESGGGDANIAYKLFLDLRHRCRWLRGVVPDYAKSAATLFLLGTDEFFMAPSAELGPLDAQIGHPDREDRTISALDVAKALGFLADFAANFIVRGGKRIHSSTNLPRTDVLREVSRFTANFLRPIAGKIDPSLWYRAAKQLDIAHRYARSMLALRRPKPGAAVAPEDEQGDRGEQREAERRLVERLVEDYPSHDAIISREEARGLPLPVRNAEEYDRWAQVWSVHRAFHAGVFRDSDGDLESLIVIWDDEELERFFNEDSSTGPEGPDSPEEGHEEQGHDQSPPPATGPADGAGAV